MKNQNQNPPNLFNSTPLETWSGDPIWIQGHILRQLPPQNGESVPTVVPIPVFFDPRTGRILTNTLPSSIRDEYENKFMDPLSKNSDTVIDKESLTDEEVSINEQDDVWSYSPNNNWEWENKDDNNINTNHNFESFKWDED